MFGSNNHFGKGEQDFFYNALKVQLPELFMPQLHEKSSTTERLAS